MKKHRYCQDSRICDICGKPRSTGRKTGGHAKCSKIRQKQFAEKRSDTTTDALAVMAVTLTMSSFL
jgi:hypothetical protein